MCQEQCNNWYETLQTVFDVMKRFTGKLDCYNNQNILTLNETIGTYVTSHCVSVSCVDLKTDQKWNKSLHIVPVGRYRHHIHGIIE
jgi:hypothetical protein